MVLEKVNILWATHDVRKALTIIEPSIKRHRYLEQQLRDAEYMSQFKLQQPPFVQRHCQECNVLKSNSL